MVGVRKPHCSLLLFSDKVKRKLVYHQKLMRKRGSLRTDIFIFLSMKLMYLMAIRIFNSHNVGCSHVSQVVFTRLSRIQA